LTVRPFDPQAVAAVAIGRRRTRYSRRSVLLLVAAAAVLVALVGGVLLVGSGILNPKELTPKHPPLPWPLAGVVESAGSLLLPNTSGAVVLADGRVFVAGYTDLNGKVGAQIWDPKTGTATPTQPMARPRSPWSMVRLNDGRVLLTGGDYGPVNEPTAEIFDPGTGAFTLLTSRPSTIESSAVLLRDGRVLLSGGYTSIEPDLNGNREVSFQAELFDPVSNSFAPTPAMHRRRTGHAMQVLSDGRVLLLGGSVEFRNQGQASIEVFNPTTGQFEIPRGHIVVNEVFDRWATLQGDRVMVLRQPAFDQYPARSLPMTVHEYDPALGVEKEGPTIPEFAPVYNVQALVALSDSRVLVYGFDKASYIDGRENGPLEKGWIGVLDVDTGELAELAVRDRSRGVVLAMPSGRVVIVGGSERAECAGDGVTYPCMSESSAIDMVR
jgi:hypothetical protein